MQILTVEGRREKSIAAEFSLDVSTSYAEMSYISPCDL